MTETTETFQTWAIIPAADGDLTQFYSGSSVYCLTPCSEEVARRVAGQVHVRPTHLLELSAPREAAGGLPDDDDDDRF